MKAYSEDLRIRVLAALDRGMSRAQAARTFQVSGSSIDRWRAQRSAIGHLRPKRSPGRPRKIAPNAERSLRAQLSASPDATLGEHVNTWADEQGTALSRWTMSRAIARLRISRKKVSERLRARPLGTCCLPSPNCRDKCLRPRDCRRIRLQSRLDQALCTCPDW